jgi:hypothetical protein
MTSVAIFVMPSDIILSVIMISFVMQIISMLNVAEYLVSLMLCECVCYECRYAKHNFVALLCWACSECLFAKCHYAVNVKSVFLLSTIVWSVIMVSVIV